RVGGASTAPTESSNAEPSNVVPLRRAEVVPAAGPWGMAQARLASEDRALFDAWFSGLADAGVAGDCLTLVAPTRFHANYVQTHLIERLRIAVSRADAAIRQVRLTAP
uniref:DnaA N-terminal domain-containing protein n=1 Tax=Paracoccus sp. TaxID=267 RepID=UPI0035B42537